MNREIAIKTAVRWWADKLKTRQPHSNGDNSPTSVFACLLADMGTNEVCDDKLGLFMDELTAQINTYMDKFNDRYVSIMCDYGPGAMLCEAAEKADINSVNFPFKTSISIVWREDEHEYVVYAFNGYGAPREELQPYDDQQG